MLKDLQTNGLETNVNGKTRVIYFELFNIIGDNAEAHNLLGFHESFNSNYPCQKCYMSKQECKIATKEKANLLRSTEKHIIDVKEKLHGVKSDSIFLKINDFDIFKHVAFDPLHDIFEGICRYEMADISYHLISSKCFTYGVFKQRMENFNFNARTDKNITPSISLDQINLGIIIISASEMKFLVENLTFYVGVLLIKFGNFIFLCARLYF